MADINLILKHIERADSQLKMIRKLLREPITGELEKRQPKKFEPPTPDLVDAICRNKGWRVDGKRFCEWYDAAGWKDREGKQIKNWFILAFQWHKREIMKAGTNNAGVGNTLDEAMS